VNVKVEMMVVYLKAKQQKRFPANYQKLEKSPSQATDGANLTEI
jgi:hypothetical protein